MMSQPGLAFFPLDRGEGVEKRAVKGNIKWKSS